MATQMLEITYHLPRSAHNGRLTITVDYPEVDTGSGDYYCRVMSDDRNALHLDAYGVLPQQAIRLALEMVSAKVGNILCSELTQNSEDEGVSKAEEEKARRRKRRK